MTRSVSAPSSQQQASATPLRPPSISTTTRNRAGSCCATRHSKSSDRCRTPVTLVELSAVAAEILSRAPVHGVRLVGIDGPAGSGKTTLARRLAPLLSAPIATTDDFLSWTDLETWWPRFEQEVLAPL